VARAGRVRGIEIDPAALPFSVCSLDVETDGTEGPLLSYAIASHDVERVVAVTSGGAPKDARATFVRSETALLSALLEDIATMDPDLIVGWNVVEFDLTVLERRCAANRIPFTLGRAGEIARVLGEERGSVSVARVPGRVFLDGIATLKSATWSFERMGLDDVGQALLGRGKVDIGARSKREKIERIRHLAAHDPDALAAYNLEDAKLALAIFERADLVGFARARAELVGLPLDRQGGSVAAFDHLYLPRLHRAGHVARDVGVEVEPAASPGGEVLASVPGLHRGVLAFDFRSLYPSIIRTFRIDPLGLARGASSPAGGIEGFDGARFARTPSILPDLIDRLTKARKDALARGREALSRAIKIQMNSFYGVLGTPGCRFFDPRLASSITKRGHEIIHRARDWFEARGMRVLYGDTDSLFVAPSANGPPDPDGKALAESFNRDLAASILERHGVESTLELRLDARYESFLMPTIRGSEVGSKKRYAGAVREADGSLRVVVRGLESVRTDWTPLARRVQRELIRRVFEGEPYDDYLRAEAARLRAGEADEELVYRKRLRRDLAAYGAAPAHVRAARLLGPEADPDEIEYVITRRGPVPAREPHGPLDYTHYVDKQLAPACDVVLGVLGTSFERLAGRQLSLF